MTPIITDAPVKVSMTLPTSFFLVALTLYLNGCLVPSDLLAVISTMMQYCAGIMMQHLMKCKALDVLRDPIIIAQSNVKSRRQYAISQTLRETIRAVLALNFLLLSNKYKPKT